MNISFGLLINAIDYYLNGNLKTSTKKIPSYEMAGLLLDSITKNEFYSLYESSSTVNRFINCKRELPREINKLVTNNTFDEGYVLETIDEIIKWFDDENLIRFINYILEIISNDTKIGNNFIIDDEVTKGNIKYHRKITANRFIYNILIYCILNSNATSDIENTLKEQKNKSFIYTNNYIDSTIDAITKCNLSTTIVNNNFNDLFCPLQHKHKINTTNHQITQLYYLRPQLHKFDLSGLAEFIDDNVCEYALSRIEYSNYDSHNLKKMARNVRKRIIEASMNNSVIIDEILLYYILEHELHAPKVMTRLEFISNNQNPLSSSVHMLKINNNYEFIYAQPMSDDNYITVINSIFEKIKTIINAETNEYEYISKLDTINNTLSKDDTNIIKSILFNKQHDDIEMAFSIFIGYTFKNEIGSYFRNKLELQLNTDIEKITDEINKRISELNLIDTSFYIYVIPFNDIKKDYVKLLEEQDL